MPYPGREHVEGQTMLGSDHAPNCTVSITSKAGTNTGIMLTSKAGTQMVLYIDTGGKLSCGTWDQFVAGTVVGVA